MSFLRSALRTRALVAPGMPGVSTRAFTASTPAFELRTLAERVVHPADVVAGDAVGPKPVRQTAAEVDVATVSDAPAELRTRQVRIYKPTKSTMQSAKGKTRVWRIDWDVLQGAGRWVNPLIGWQSSADYMQGTTLAFRTREDAVRFAERQGWDYFVQEPKPIRIPPKNYADNYLHVPGPLRICHTK